MKHLKLVTPEDVNPNNLSYDEISEKITKFMDVLDLIQDLGLEDEFPQLENQISNLVKAQQSMEEEHSEPPPFPQEVESSNLIDLSAYFVIKSIQSKMTELKRTPKEVNGNIIQFSKLEKNSEDSSTEDAG